MKEFFEEEATYRQRYCPGGGGRGGQGRGREGCEGRGGRGGRGGCGARNSFDGICYNSGREGHSARGCWSNGGGAYVDSPSAVATAELFPGIDSNALRRLPTRR